MLHFAYSVVCFICNKTNDYAQQCSSESAIYDLTIKHNEFSNSIFHTNLDLTTSDMLEPGTAGEAVVHALFNDATSVQ